MSRAVFLDRDGTINVERRYLHDPEALEIFPGTGLALKRLMDAGYALFIVTNQSGIGRGYYQEKDMHAVNDRLIEVLASHGAEVSAADARGFTPLDVGTASRPLHPTTEALLRDLGAVSSRDDELR